MSSYSVSVVAQSPYTPTGFDKLQAYQLNAKPNNNNNNNNNNFSVSHLLDLEELPRENCAMYANTDQNNSLQEPCNDNGSEDNDRSGGGCKLCHFQMSEIDAYYHVQLFSFNVDNL